MKSQKMTEIAESDQGTPPSHCAPHSPTAQTGIDKVVYERKAIRSCCKDSVAAVEVVLETGAVLTAPNGSGTKSGRIHKRSS